MLIIISPAKTLDVDTPTPVEEHTTPRFLNQASRLVEVLKVKDAGELGRLMKIRQKLAKLNVARYAQWCMPFTPGNARQAIFAFQGDVYVGLNAASLDRSDIDFAQARLRILSGLYGLLRPLDLMQAYRLEMGTRLVVNGGKSLYDFWGGSITEALNHDLAGHVEPTLINLASGEHFRAIRPQAFNGKIITPVFREWKNGAYKVIGLKDKKARGMMCRYMITRRIEQSEEIKAFREAGYAFSPELSDEHEWVFIRE
jgi:hypothetical protein